MSAIALVGNITLLISQAMLEKILLPLMAFAAGALIGGAFFLMIPAALSMNHDVLEISVMVIVGFTMFFCLGTIAVVASLSPSSTRTKAAADISDIGW